jgi:hypothetical protein
MAHAARIIDTLMQPPGDAEATSLLDLLRRAMFWLLEDGSEAA